MYVTLLSFSSRNFSVILSLQRTAYPTFNVHVYFFLYLGAYVEGLTFLLNRVSVMFTRSFIEAPARYILIMASSTKVFLLRNHTMEVLEGQLS